MNNENISDKEEIILNVLNTEASSWIHLMDNDRKQLAHIISQILEAIDESKKEAEHKKWLKEIEAKLELLTELGKLHDEQKKIPFYKFLERNEIEWKIIDLETKMRYGVHV